MFKNHKETSCPTALELRFNHGHSIIKRCLAFLKKIPYYKSGPRQETQLPSYLHVFAARGTKALLKLREVIQLLRGLTQLTYFIIYYWFVLNAILISRDQTWNLYRIQFCRVSLRALIKRNELYCWNIYCIFFMEYYRNHWVSYS